MGHYHIQAGFRMTVEVQDPLTSWLQDHLGGEDLGELEEEY